MQPIHYIILTILIIISAFFSFMAWSEVVEVKEIISGELKVTN